MSIRIEPCPECHGEGRYITMGTVYETGCGHPHLGEVDHGLCPECNGACVVEVTFEPRTLSDLDEEDLEEMQTQLERTR